MRAIIRLRPEGAYEMTDDEAIADLAGVPEDKLTSAIGQSASVEREMRIDENRLVRMMPNRIPKRRPETSPRV